MRLTSFRVRRYKNVIDSTDVPVQQDVTTLVGMNESGKSTMLDALYKLNPVYGDKFVERELPQSETGAARRAALNRLRLARRCSVETDRDARSQFR